MSGPGQRQGNAAFNAVSAAIRSINATGGFKGSKVKIVLMDSDGNRERVAQGASTLVSDSRTLFITGPTHPAFTGIVAAFTASKKIPFFITAGSVTAVKRRGRKYTDWMFRTTIDLSASFRALLRQCRKRGIHKIGILVANTKQGREAMLLLRGYAPEYNMEVTTVSRFDTSDSDMMLQFRECRKSGAEIVFVEGPASSMNALAESALFASLPLAIPVTMLSSSFLKNSHSLPELWTALPPVAADDLLPSTHPSAFSVQKFYINMPDDFSSATIEEKLAAGAAWDAIYLALHAAVQIPGKPTRQLLRNALEKMETGYNGVTGHFQPDKRDHAGLDIHSLIPARFKNGRWQRL
jgi:branched-chain amino acid transport system substrate-binding protein